MYCRFLVQITIAVALLFTISFGEEHKNSSVETSQTQTPTTGSRHSGNSVPYQAPRSVSYPFGDEDMVNNNMLNKSAATEANCAEENEFIEYKPECTGPVDGTDELYVSCLKNELTVEPTDTIYSASKSASSPPVYLPSFMCKRCDLQKNSENTAVIIHCVHCYDQDNQSNRTEPA